MRRVRTTKARRESAVARIARGESTIEQEARKLHVKPTAVKVWITMSKRGTSMGRKKGKRSIEPDELEAKPDSSTEPSSSRLDRALRSAELEDGETSSSEETSSPSSVPAPDPEALVAFVETIRGQALKLYSAVLGLNPTDPLVEELLAFTEKERASLAMWSPYAARYVPELIGNEEKVGAWIFVGVNVASLWTGMAALRRLAPKKAPREPEETFPGPGAPPAMPPVPTPA